MASAEIGITVDLAQIDVLLNGFEGRVQRVVAKYAALIEARAKQLSPVLTGALRASITTHLDGWVAEITAGENLDYAVYVEYGAHNHPAQPFLRPAIEQFAASFTAEIGAIFGG